MSFWQLVCNEKDFCVPRFSVTIFMSGYLLFPPILPAEFSVLTWDTQTGKQPYCGGFSTVFGAVFCCLGRRPVCYWYQKLVPTATWPRVCELSCLRPACSPASLDPALVPTAARGGKETALMGVHQRTCCSREQSELGHNVLSLNLWRSNIMLRLFVGFLLEVYQIQ